MDNGEYALVFTDVEADDRKIKSTYSIDFTTECSLAFHNLLLLPAMMFTTSETVICDSKVIAPAVIVEGGYQTISSNIQNHLPVLNFSAEQFRVQDNTRLDLKSGLTSESYYTVSP